MSRERVIVDIEDMEQAAKVEETVKSGYCDTIEDNLAHWIAAEEDIVDSYSQLAEKARPDSAKGLRELIVDSRNTVSELRSFLQSFESMSRRRASRIDKIRDLEKSGP